MMRSLGCGPLAWATFFARYRSVQAVFDNGQVAPQAMIDLDAAALDICLLVAAIADSCSVLHLLAACYLDCSVNSRSPILL
jgi:hypothetical protein